MAETIDNIVSQEVFDQLKKLSESINQCDIEMRKCIVTANEMGKQLSQATGIANVSKTFDENIAKVNEMTDTHGRYVKEVNKLVSASNSIKESMAGLTRQQDYYNKILIESENEKARYLRLIDNERARNEKLGTSLRDMQAKLTEANREIKEYTRLLGSADAKDSAERVRYYSEKLEEAKEKSERFSAAVNTTKSELAESKATIAEMNVALKLHEKVLGEAEGSYEQNAARVKLLQHELRSMSDEEVKNSESGRIFTAELAELNAKLKDMKIAMGEAKEPRFTAGVREARNELMTLGYTLKSLKTDLEEQRRKAEEVADSQGRDSEAYKQMTEAIKQGESAIKEMEAQYDQLQIKTAELVKTQKEVAMQMSALAKPTANIDAMVGSVGLLANSFTVLKTTAHMFGIENEAVEKSMAKIYMVQQSLNAINQIARTVNKNSIVVLKAKALWTKLLANYQSYLAKNTKAAAAATQVETAAETKNTAATAASATATGTLAATETAATASSFSLATAIKAVGVAIKTLPVVGQLLAIIGAVATLATIIFKISSMETENNRISMERNKLDAEHLIKMDDVDRKQEIINERLREQVEIINGGASTPETYSRAMEDVAAATGLSVEYLERHKNELGGIVDLAGDVAKANGRVEETENELAEIMGKRSGLEIEILNISKLNEKEAKQALKQMVEEEKITKKQKGLIEYNLRYAKDEGKMREIVNKILDHNVEISDEIIGKRKEQLESEKELRDEKQKQLDIIVSQAKYEENLKVSIENTKKSYTDYLNSVASLTGKASDKRKAATEAENQAYKKQNEDRLKWFKEATAGMERDSEEFLALQKENTERYLNDWKTHKNNLEKVDKDYYKESANLARQAKDMRSDIRIGELKLELEATHDTEKKMALNRQIEEEELQKKIRSIKAQEKVSADIINDQIELAKMESNERIAKYEKDIMQKQIDLVIKSAKALSDAIANVDSEKLKSLQFDIAGTTDLEKLKEMKQQEIDLLLEMETKKNEQIQKDNKNNKDAELKDLEEGSEAYNNIVKKYDELEQAETLRNSNEVLKIKRQQMTNQIAIMQEAMNQLEQKARDSMNEQVISQGKDLNSDQQLIYERNLAAERVRLFKEQEEAYSHDEETRKQYYQQLLEYEADLVKKEQAIAEQRMQSLKDLGGAFMELGNLIAESMEDELQQTKIKQALSVAQVLMNQGIAISEAVKTGMAGDPYTAEIRVATAVMTVITSIASAMNAVKQARASVQEAESYAEGTDYHHGGAAIIGEAGYPELVMSKGKSFVVDAPTFFPNLPVGSKVIPLYNSTVTDLSPVLASMEELKHKETVQVNVGKDVYTYIWNGAGRTRILNKKFMH